MLAVTEGDNSMVELLVEAGADLDAVDQDGDTDVHFAVVKAASNETEGDSEPSSMVGTPIPISLPGFFLIAHHWTGKKIISRYCKATKNVAMCNNIFHRLHKCHALWKVVIAKLVSLIFLWLHFLQEISKPSARYTELLLVRLIGKMLSAVYLNC